jgi:protein arginine kinase
MKKWYIDVGPDSDVVISSRVRLARNFEAYPFPSRSSPEQQRAVIKETVEALTGDDAEFKAGFTYIDFKKLDETQKLVYVEKRLVSKELAESRREVGLLISNDEQISIMINEEDHLRIQCLASGMQLERAFEICNYIDNKLSQKIDFAFNDLFGYLTSCPTNIGTAIRASIMLHLPALTMTGYIRSVLESCGKLGLAVRGLYGENTEARGNMYQLSNQITLGKSEQDIVMSIKTITDQIIEQERLLRAEILKRNGVALEDKIMRSFGTLKYARTISSDEALQRLSDVRLGIDAKLISDLDQTDVNEMMLQIQPGSLQQYFGRPLTTDELESVRASYIRDHIAGKSGRNE